MLTYTCCKKLTRKHLYYYFAYVQPLLSRKRAAFAFDPTNSVLKSDMSLKSANSDSKKIAKDSTDEISSSDDDERWREPKRKPDDLPSEYWSLQKLIKYVKSGNPIATNDCLCCIRSYDLSVQINQLAIFNIGGLEVLVNLLISNNITCRLGALYILKSLTKNIDYRRYVIDLHAIESLVIALGEPAADVKALAADIMANLAKIRLARKLIRNIGAIPKLIDLMDCDLEILRSTKLQPHTIAADRLNLAAAGSRAISWLVNSRRNVKVAEKYALFRITARLLKSTHTSIILPALKICQLLAYAPSFQVASDTEKIIPDIIVHLHSSDENVVTEACVAVFKCANNTRSREILHEINATELIFKLLQNKSKWTDEKFLEAATGALYMCSMLEKNATELDNTNAMPVFMEILEFSVEICDAILANTCGAIAQLLKLKNATSTTQFCTSPQFELTISFLNYSYEPLLQNASAILVECCKDEVYAKRLDELEGTRLLWSLLKNPNSHVKANASWALCEYIQKDENSGKVIRSLVCALELVASLLKSTDNVVLASTCALISHVAKDENNLAILTEYNVIPQLARLVNDNDEHLQEHLASAIASCSTYGENTQKLGELRTITPIVRYLASTNKDLHRTAATALENLSTDPFNCVTMHQNGVVPFLLEAIGSTDRVLQSAAANCLRNIRKLTLTAEEATL